MAKYQNQHFVPKTYLKAWGKPNPNNPNPNNNDWIVSGYNKETGEFEEIISIENNFSENYLHSIVAAMPICNAKDIKNIFSILNTYVVKYKGKTLTLSDYNEYFHCFHEWQIYRDTVIISDKEKKQIYNHIKAIKINEIEMLWGQKYESKWSKTREIICEKTKQLGYINEFCKDFLMKFIISMSFRGAKPNVYFENIVSHFVDHICGLDKVDIPENERVKPLLSTASKEVKHELLINYYRKFLNNEGMIYDMANKDIDDCSIIFYKAAGKVKFATSDTPCFIPHIDIFNLLHSNIKLMIPITPDIIAISIKKKTDKYQVISLSDDTVKRINNEIHSQASKYTVLLNRTDLTL